MKFDLHCHTKEGSLDAHVGLEEYVKNLISQGFDGMLVTDHNSYKGFDKWNEIKNKIKTSKPFTVLKGIEYDTLDGGHFIAVLPDEVSCKLLELRGLTISELEKVVHHLGGILGPAHPYESGFFAFMHTRPGKHNKKLMEKFDFVETYNSCAHPNANEKARALAEKWKLPHTAGSDAHRLSAIGTAFTEFSERIQSNNDLIRQIKRTRPCPQKNTCPVKTKCTNYTAAKIITPDFPHVPSDLMKNVYSKSNVILREASVIAYYIYNKTAAAFRFPARRRAKRHYSTLIQRHSA